MADSIDWSGWSLLAGVNEQVNPQGGADDQREDSEPAQPSTGPSGFDDWSAIAPEPARRGYVPGEQTCEHTDQNAAQETSLQHRTPGSYDPGVNGNYGSLAAVAIGCRNAWLADIKTGQKKVADLIAATLAGDRQARWLSRIKLKDLLAAMPHVGPKRAAWVMSRLFNGEKPVKTPTMAWLVNRKVAGRRIMRLIAYTGSWPDSVHDGFPWR